MKQRMKRISMFVVICLFFLGATRADAFYARPYKWGMTTVAYNRSEFGPDVATAVWCGAVAWNNVTPSPFQWVASYDGFNLLYFEWIDGRERILARTYVWQENGLISYFYMGFDNGESWHIEGTLPPPDKLDMIGTAAHEFGHALGLGDTQSYNCSSNPATMCGTYDYGVSYARSLETDDRNGLHYHYP